ncbi:hypothetical protein [uncultured Alistipes sp.]|uniref:hypothetical protein n=1 Tax=uncultured Alistipes sp. TaxID=538949 RepID=UPI002590D196|nr:hypothetical protein [uncultured Alistipes sp.]
MKRQFYLLCALCAALLTAACGESRTGVFYTARYPVTRVEADVALTENSDPGTGEEGDGSGDNSGGGETGDGNEDGTGDNTGTGDDTGTGDSDGTGAAGGGNPDDGGEGGEGTGEGDSEEDGEEDGGSGENPLVAQIETEIVSAAPVQAGGGYTLHFSQYNGGRAEIRTAPDTEPVTGLFGKEPGKEQFEVLFGEEDYVCSPASYTDEEGERKIVLEVDLTEQYQALYPAAGITRAVRREYTSANAY